MDKEKLTHLLIMSYTHKTLYTYMKTFIKIAHRKQQMASSLKIMSSFCQIRSTISNIKLSMKELKIYLDIKTQSSSKSIVRRIRRESYLEFHPSKHHQ
jgi:hypothetical protein